MTLSITDQQISQMSAGEKASILQRVTLDLIHTWPGIEKTPRVQGGDACIIRTRIPVWTLEAYRRVGWDDEQILASFPTLRPADLFYAWLYVDGNRKEIEQNLREQEEA